MTPLTAAELAVDPRCPMILHVCSRLTRLLIESGVDPKAAHTTAVRSLRSFVPETDADVLAAGDVVSFQMASLDLLHDAAAPGVTPAMKLRLVGQAIAASRIACRTETLLEQRRKFRSKGDPAVVNAMLGNNPPTPAPVESHMDRTIRQAYEQFVAEVAAQQAEAATPQATTPEPDTASAIPASTEAPAQPEPPLSRPVADPVIQARHLAPPGAQPAPAPQKAWTAVHHQMDRAHQRHRDHIHTTQRQRHTDDPARSTA